MSNFDFLKLEFHDIYISALKAEENVFADPRTSCFYSRFTLETAVKWLYQNDSFLKLPYDTSLSSLIHEQTFKDNLDPKLFAKLKTIQKVGNIAAHSPKQIGERDSLNVLQELFHFLYWLYRFYSTKTPDRDIIFNLELIPRPEKKADEFDKIAEILKQKEQELFEKEKLIQEAEARLAHIQAIKEENSRVPDNYDYNEAQTREYFIDVLLKEAGWNINDPNVCEFEVEGMPNNQGKGYVDYVLWGDNGLPLAVVEAKRTKKDPKVGKQQAKLYADCLEEKFKQRPVIFYTNGYEHFIWDDVNYPPRQVQGFYKKDELQLLINRRQSRQTLKSVPVNTNISGRPYQLEAIKRVCEDFENRKRKALVVMATGTGKTRMAIALVDVLQRANWAKRILFLADRTALLNQAKNAFNQHLPSSTIVDITDDKEDTTSRVVLSTYQTMINMIDSVKSESRVFGTGHFDLIIIDEAHRSVYRKYKAIFDYFDSSMLGLTATPRNEVDKNTYELFELENRVPTYYYELEQAVAQGYLVPPKSYDVPIKYLRESIKYDELSDAEKEDYEVLFYDEDTGQLPLEIDPAALNKWLFNEDTVDKVLAHIMQHGIKVQGGDKLGKTIIFAKNHDHAEFIQERFDKNYPKLTGSFARVIDNYATYAQSLINDFSVKTKEPTIAISVDMLDTGIDVPEVVNLVFFKIVRSKTKFHQMIGRGTRLCPDLFAPGADKEHFYIFDFCMNFEFFNQCPDGVEAKVQLPLSQKIFIKRLELAESLKNNDEQLRILSEKLKDILHNEVKHMNTDNFIVRPHRKQVEKYCDRTVWENINPEENIEIRKKLSGLPSETPQEDELAKRFDLMILNMQFAVLEHWKNIEKLQNKLKDIAEQLEEKRSIPMVNAQLELILDMQTDEFWVNITIPMLEEVRVKIRDLIQFLDKSEKKIIYSDFEDEIGTQQEIQAGRYETASDLTQYRKKVEHFLKEHKNHVAFQKLRLNKPITPTDIQELERILFVSGGLENRELFEKAFGKEQSLSRFIRTMIGLDRKAAEELFADYLKNAIFTANQITFVTKIIDYLTQNGIMELGILYEPPFTDFHSNGIEGLFKEDKVNSIISLIKNINNNAEIQLRMSQ